MVNRINAYAEEYAKEYEFEIVMVESRKKILLEVINRYQPKTILEVGIGLDPLFLYTDPQINWLIVEPAEQFVVNAKSLAKDNSHVAIFQEYFENFTLPKNSPSVDLIILSGLLHEVPEPEKLIRKAGELATKDTIIHINVPNANSLHRQVALEAGLIKNLKELSARGEALQQYSVFDLLDLLKIVDLAKFNLINQGGYFLKPLTHQQFASLLKNQLLSKDVIDGFHQLGVKYPELAAEIFIELTLN